MNNRFKFKVWDKINNKWMPHRLLDITNGFLTEFYDEEQSFNRRYVLAQCTGLKDRNGKLIYEGDIVHNITNNKVGKVEWAIYDDEEGYYNFRHLGYIAGRIGYKNNIATIMDYIETIEVIGNIYENPTLLK